MRPASDASAGAAVAEPPAPAASAATTAAAPLTLNDLYRALQLRGLSLQLRPGSQLVLKGPEEQKTPKLLDFIRANRDAIIAILEVREAEETFALEDLARAADAEFEEFRAVAIAHLVHAAYQEAIPAWEAGEIVTEDGVPLSPATDPNKLVRFLYTYVRMLYRGYRLQWRAKGTDAAACAAELTAIAFWFWPGWENVILPSDGHPGDCDSAAVEGAGEAEEANSQHAAEPDDFTFEDDSPEEY